MKKETIQEAVAVVLPLIQAQLNPKKPGIAGDMVEMLIFLQDEYGEMKMPGYWGLYSKVMPLLLCGAENWLHHVQGCFQFGTYPNCTVINKNYFGKDSEEWHKTPNGQDSDKFEASCLETAARKVIDLLAVFA